jgi:hypothetical protein
MKTMPERLTTSRPTAPAVQPASEDDEPVTPGPPDPQANRPRRGMYLPIPKASPTDTRPLNALRRQTNPSQAGN